MKIEKSEKINFHITSISVHCSSNGDLVSNQPEVLSRWAQYFDELLNDQLNGQLEAPLADSVTLRYYHLA